MRQVAVGQRFEISTPANSRPTADHHLRARSTTINRDHGDKSRLTILLAHLAVMVCAGRMPGLCTFWGCFKYTLRAFLARGSRGGLIYALRGGVFAVFENVQTAVLRQYEEDDEVSTVGGCIYTRSELARRVSGGKIGVY